MRKVVKKIECLLLCLMLALFTIACGNSVSKTSDDYDDEYEEDYDDDEEDDDEDDEEEDEEVDEEVVDEDETADSSEVDDFRSLTNSSLDPEVQSVLDSLNTDYQNVYWASVYSASSDAPGIVISVTPYTDFYENYLLVAVTNLYNSDISFSATAQAYNENNDVVGDTFFYEPCVGAANTAVAVINCGSETPDGRIHWEDVEIGESILEYIPWEADFSLSGNPTNGMMTLSYNIYSSNEKVSSNSAMLTGIILDETGFVLGVSTEYMSGLNSSGSYEGSMDIYADSKILTHTRAVAMFANPTKE